MEENSIIISNRIRLARNLNKISFPNMLNDISAKDVLSKVTSSIIDSNSYISKEFEVLDLNNMKSYERLSLVEKHLISKEILNEDKGAVLINKDENISIMINEEDHIRLQVINKGFDIKKSYDIASKIDDLMEENLDYAFDQNLGYLTSCITNLGCGLRASIMMHLPGLSKNNKIQDLANVISSYGITIRGFYGEGTEGLGNIYQVSNKSSLGISEEEIIDNLIKVVEKIIETEIKERNSLKNKDIIAFEDVIFKSLGILKYGKLISSLEALKLISNVRCGIEMGIIKNITLNSIEKSMESIQSGNIQRILSKQLNSRERDIERAKILNNIFK